MVYFHTSQNYRLIKNVMIEFQKSTDVTPKEFIEEYVRKTSLKIEDNKLTWIVDTYLGIQKHACFLYEVLNHLSEEIREEDRQYFVIALHAVTFQINSRVMDPFYKCLFNLSKPLLQTFTSFMSNNESLSYISDVAQTCYDSKYVTEKIVSPLFAWQPYISEMAHDYAMFIKETENKKYKPPTVPVQQRVLTRPGKSKMRSSESTQTTLSEPEESNKELVNKTRPLTKSAIDKKLQVQYEQNKIKAEEELKIMKNDNRHCCRTKKSEKYNKLVENIKEEMDELNRYKFAPNPNPVIVPRCKRVKETRLTLKRLDKVVEREHQKEMEWLDFLMTSSCDLGMYEEKILCNRIEEEQDRLLEIERRHLLGQLSHEEAALAKQKLIDENKKKKKEFDAEKKKWHEEIENYKKLVLEKNIQHIQNMSLQQLKLYEAKHNLHTDRRKRANAIRSTSEELKRLIIQRKREELERCAAMIKEIKVLRSIAKQAQLPRVIDLTESAGYGFLNEMTIAELSERLAQVKMTLKEELLRKRNEVREKNQEDQKNYIQTKQNVDIYLKERKRSVALEKKAKLKLPALDAKIKSSKEISDLKKLLEEKRLMRQRKEAMMSQPYY